MAETWPAQDSEHWATAASAAAGGKQPKQPGSSLTATAIAAAGDPPRRLQTSKCCFFSFKKVGLGGFWRVGLGWGVCFYVALFFGDFFLAVPVWDLLCLYIFTSFFGI